MIQGEREYRWIEAASLPVYYLGNSVSYGRRKKEKKEKEEWRREEEVDMGH